MCICVFEFAGPVKNLYLQDLPMGKYIVCGEAHKEGHVVQANCFETVIDRLDNNSEMMMMMSCCSELIMIRMMRRRKQRMLNTNI